MNINNKQILFIGPIFFDYTKLIIDDLYKKGAFVHFINQNALGYLENILRRVSLKFCKKVTNKILLKKLNDAPSKVDVVFLLHGDLLNSFFMNVLKRKYKSSLFIMHQWDSVENNQNTIFLSKYFDKIFSFDRDDCKNYGYCYLPNFYIKSKIDNKIAEPNYDLLFIGKGHTDRIILIDKIKKQLPNHIITKFIIFLPWYRYFIEKFIYRKRGILSINDFTFKKVSFLNVQELTNQSKVILDIHNPFQNGLTQRPFDALGKGKALITTNINITQEPFYDENVVQILNRKNPIINFDIFKHKMKLIKGFEEYEIENWSKKIFI